MYPQTNFWSIYYKYNNENPKTVKWLNLELHFVIIIWQEKSRPREVELHEFFLVKSQSAALDSANWRNGNSFRFAAKR